MTFLTTMVHGKTSVALCIFWNMSNIAWAHGPLAIWCRSNLDMRRRAVASIQAKNLSVIRVCTHPAAKKYKYSTLTTFQAAGVAWEQTRHVEMKRRPDDTGTPSSGKKPAARHTSRVLSTPMGGSITQRSKRGGQRHGAGVELLLHGVLRLVKYVNELVEVLLHARLQ